MYQAINEYLWYKHLLIKEKQDIEQSAYITVVF